MYTISKRFSFSAAHQLAGLPEGHQCGRMHGHNYELEIVLRCSVLDASGFVFDYGKLDFVKRMLDDTVEHRVLNEVFSDLQPSAENLAQRFFNLIGDELERRERIQKDQMPCFFLHAVRIKET